MLGSLMPHVPQLSTALMHALLRVGEQQQEKLPALLGLQPTQGVAHGSIFARAVGGGDAPYLMDGAGSLMLVHNSSACMLDWAIPWMPPTRCVRHVEPLGAWGAVPSVLCGVPSVLCRPC